MAAVELPARDRRSRDQSGLQNRVVHGDTRAAADAVGEERIAESQPSKLEFPNLRITFSESDAQPWVDWHDDFVLKGNNDDAHEKNGTLTFLAANMQDAIGEVRFFNLGIFRLAREPRAAGAEQVARMVADLYCERMELSVKA